DMDDEQSANIRLSLEDYLKGKKLPTSFISRVTEQTSAGYDAWIRARNENSFGIYAPELARMIALKIEQAELYGFEQHPYDALMDEYEKGATVSMLDPVFADVKAQLPALLNEIKKSKQVDDAFLQRYYNKDKQ